MSDSIVAILHRHPHGLTVQELTEKMGKRHPQQLAAPLRDLHWRDLIHKDRYSRPGELVYRAGKLPPHEHGQMQYRLTAPGDAAR